jgi:hypothetical protein
MIALRHVVGVSCNTGDWVWYDLLMDSGRIPLRYVKFNSRMIEERVVVPCVHILRYRSDLKICVTVMRNHY